MRFTLYLSALLLNKLVVAASCGSATITSQSDADALVAACQNVTGDIILATTANETINLDGIQAIEGNLVSEFCSSSCASFTSLSSSTLVSVSQNISLINLSGLTNITFPQLQTVGAPFYLDSLPNLQTLNIPTLSSVGQFHLGSTPKLLSMNLNQLQNVTGQNPSIEIISVSLLYFENLNVNTNLSSFILRDTQSSEGFDMSIPQVDYLEIQPGNGVGLRFSFSTSSGTGSGFVSRVGTLNMSGCNSFEADSTTYDTIILNKNTFSYLNLAPIRVLNNLSILDNGNLNQATLPSNMSIENIEIRDNGVLQGSDLSAGVGSWPWGIKNISSMILEGPFEPNFFNQSNLTLVEISKSFSLKSTDPTFDCTFLNSLRKEGYFQGNYSCQDKTLAAGHVRTTAGSAGSTITTPLISVFVFVMLSVAYVTF